MATFAHNTKQTKRPKGVFSVLLVLNLNQLRRIDRARLACDLRASELSTQPGLRAIARVRPTDYVPSSQLPQAETRAISVSTSSWI